MFSRARTARITIKLSKSVLRKMRRRGVRRVTVRLRVSVSDLEGQKRAVTRSVRIRRA